MDGKLESEGDHVLNTSQKMFHNFTQEKKKDFYKKLLNAYMTSKGEQISYVDRENYEIPPPTGTYAEVHFLVMTEPRFLDHHICTLYILYLSSLNNEIISGQSNK